MAVDKPLCRDKSVSFGSFEDPLPFASQAQTDYGEDISPLIVEFLSRESTTPGTSTQGSSNVTTSASSSQQSRKRPNSPSLDDSRRASKRKRVDIISKSLLPQPYVIAASERIQKAGLSSGVRWELARLITLGVIDSAEKIKDTDLASLHGNNEESAPKVARVFSSTAKPDTQRDPAFTHEAAATSPWPELDREEETLAKDPYAGLGHSQVAPGWYGGKIEFTGRLERDGGKSYKIKLNRCEIGPSCRFYRRFGSNNFIRIKVDKQILHSSKNNVERFACRPFVLWGAVFRAFFAKEGTFFLVKTNEQWVDGKIVDSQDGLTVLDTVNFHNPLSFPGNQNQTMCKWSARTALALSNSVPGPLLEAENITYENDIISDQGSEMTDGCGTANRATTLAVSRLVDPESYSVAFQFRLGGLKGMALEDATTSTREPFKVIGRNSQVKIRYPPNHHDPLDPTLRIIDILRLSHMRSPSSISAETIINLSDNGVPPSIFTNLLKTTLESVVTGLTTWEGPDAMYDLWTKVERSGSVLYARRAREAAGEARARGLGGYSNEDDDQDEDDVDALRYDIGQDRSKAWWADQISGCPSSLEETVLVLLDAGFRPQDSSILRDKLKQVVKTAVKTRTAKYKYDLAQSASAFVVPDPCNVLGPDEIHIKSSRRNLQMKDDISTDIIVGDVLMTRNPCKVPTDVRKVRAVEHPLLRSYTDVIVCSVQGHRRLLDFLAGGDYDGDTAIVIWTPEIVEHFKNADEKYANEPPDVDECFTSNNEKVGDFQIRTAGMTPLEKTFEVQSYLLRALRDSFEVGHYSTMHDRAVYQLGYSHPESISLAYKFCKVLDGAKNGLKIRKDAYDKDRNAYPASRLSWKETAKSTEEEGRSAACRNEAFARRSTDSPHVKGKFIMDILQSAAKKERDRILARIEDPSLFGRRSNVSDPHLTEPWKTAVEASERGDPRVVKAMKNDLQKIQHHVEELYQEHKDRRMPIQHEGKSRSFTSLPIEVRQDILRAFSKRFASYPTSADMEVHTDPALIARLRASYAFTYDLQQKASSNSWSRFSWDLAMRDLCLIKANALGPSKTVTTGFYERFKMARR